MTRLLIAIVAVLTSGCIFKEPFERGLQDPPPPPPLPGQQVVAGIPNLVWFAADARDVYWAVAAESPGTKLVLSAPLARAPIDATLQRVSGRSDGPVAAAGDGIVLGVHGTRIVALESGKATPIVEAADRVLWIAVDRDGPQPILVWTRRGFLEWRGLHGGSITSIAVPDLGDDSQVVITASYIWVSTNGHRGANTKGYGGYLGRVSRISPALEQLASIQDFEVPNVDLGTSYSHVYTAQLSSSALVPYRDSVAWLIYQRTGPYADLHRGSIAVASEPHEAAHSRRDSGT